MPTPILIWLNEPGVRRRTSSSVFVDQHAPLADRANLTPGEHDWRRLDQRYTGLA